MDLDFAIIFTKLLLLLGRNVLIPQKHNTPLSDEQGKLVSLVIRQVLQLDPFDLGANVRSQVCHFSSSG